MNSPVNVRRCSLGLNPEIDMEVIQIGNIADSVVSHIAEVMPYAEEDILKYVVKEILPDCGIVIEASKEEIMGNKDLGGVLYSKCRIVKEDD